MIAGPADRNICRNRFQGCTAARSPPDQRFHPQGATFPSRNLAGGIQTSSQNEFCVAARFVQAESKRHLLFPGEGLLTVEAAVPAANLSSLPAARRPLKRNSPRRGTFARIREFVYLFSMADKPSKLKIADREFTSRLLVGTGKFASNELMRDALIASGTELVTVALRRADLSGEHDPFANILAFIDPKRFLLLPNTSGARNATEAVRLARLAVAAGLPNWIKLEIHPDPRYLLPDPVETLAAAEILVKEGFIVLPYINADPVLAKRLEDVGCATVMPLGSPIGSNRGIETRPQIEIIIEQATVPGRSEERRV